MVLAHALKWDVTQDDHLFVALLEADFEVV